MVDFEQINKVNKLAKALKESGMAATMDDAVKMAQDMVSKGEESIEELSEKPSAEELVKEEFKEGPINKAKNAIDKVKEVLHIEEKEAVKPFEMKSAEEMMKKVEKEGLEQLKERAKELKEKIKEKEEKEEAEEGEEEPKEVEEE